MLYEAPLADLAFWRTAVSEKTGEKPVLICVMRWYPRWLGKLQFDVNAPELGPPAEMLKHYKNLEARNLSIAPTMRAWGSTIKEKERIAKYKAFTDAFGPNAVYLRRHWSNDKKAIGLINKIRFWLEKGRDVVLFCNERKPPCHRYILMHMIRRDRSLADMFRTLKYDKEYLAFADRVEGRYGRMARREI